MKSAVILKSGPVNSMVDTDIARMIDVLEEMQTKDLEDAINIVEWGRWSRGGIPTGRTGIDVVTPLISDDDALKIDSQVAKLPGRAKLVMKAHYIGQLGINEMSKRLNISKQKIINYRSQGLNIIYGALKNA